MTERDDYVIMSDATFRGAQGAVFANTTWRCRSSERWAIRGPSGAGKSLFIQALMGRLPRLAGTLEHPFLAGQAHCRDSVFGVLPQGTIAVASMDQHRAILAARGFHQLRWHGSLTTGALRVNEFLTWASVAQKNPFLVSERGDTEIAQFEAVCRREVTRWRLEPLLDRPLLALSNGELHRLLIARALMLEPRLLIVDDPCSGLDVSTRGRLAENLATLQDEGLGVLYAVSRDEDVPVTVSHEIDLESSAATYAGPRRSVVSPKSIVGVATPKTKLRTPQESEVVLELRDVSVCQANVTLLDSVDLVVHAAERWALVGPNGAGKSTLLSLILADNPQTYRNHVVVGGRQLGPGTSIWDIKRLVGWVSPELDAHYPAATPIAEVVLSGFRSSLGLHEAIGQEARTAALAWLERVGLEANFTHELGGTSRLVQRLAFLARACVHRPRILLLDEPCQGLDANDRARFATALDGCLSELGAALIYVSHELAELPASIDHWLELRAGGIPSSSARGD